MPLEGGGSLKAEFREKYLEFALTGKPSDSRLRLVFEWVPDLSTLQQVSTNRLNYTFRDFNYSVQIDNGVASKTADGVAITSNTQDALRLLMHN